MGKLNVKQIEALQPKSKPYRVADGDGLTLQVNPNGKKKWLYRYRLNNKASMYTIGTFPNITLKEARLLLTEARGFVSKGLNPAKMRELEKARAVEEAERSRLKARNTFEVIAREWWLSKADGWSEKHRKQVIVSLENDAFPAIGGKTIDTISPQEILDILRGMENRGANELARRVHQRIRAIFNYAKIKGLILSNPAEGMEQALKPVPSGKTKNYISLPLGDLPEFLQRLTTYPMHLTTKSALKFLILTARRTIEIRTLRFEHIDFENRTFTLPTTKNGLPHTEFLSKQAMQILLGMREQGVSDGYVFPGVRDSSKMLSENTLLYSGIYRLGYHSRASVHGFRHLFSTAANELGVFSSDAIERQLAHTDSNKIRAVYNKAQYGGERRLMMQWWSDWIEQMERTGEVGNPKDFLA